MEKASCASNDALSCEEEKVFDVDIPEDIEPDSWPECCICRVPINLRRINEDAYTPQVVTIGPFHNDNLRKGAPLGVSNEHKFVAMERQKVRYLREFRRRTGKTLNQLAMEIKRHELRIRRSYQETFEHCSSNVFVKMILLDSAFIIELFNRLFEMDTGYRSENDAILSKPWLRYCVRNDLMLLENQIPFFILQELYKTTAFSDHVDQLPSFDTLACYFFYGLIAPPRILQGKEDQTCGCDCFSCFYGFWLNKFFSCRKSYHDDNPHQSSSHPGINHPSLGELIRKFETEEKPKHFVDLLRKFRAYNQPPEPKKAIGWATNVYSATKLHESGVKFEVVEASWPLDIKFESGVLKMPRFEVEDRTESVVRNLMAFEQCFYPYHAYICNYMVFLDFLIDTERDVDLLLQHGIITNLLGDSRSVADLMNSLCKQIVRSNFCFNDVCLKLNTHYENCWYRTVAMMRSVYFSNLWTGTGTIAGVVLLVLTLLQTIYSIKK